MATHSSILTWEIPGQRSLVGYNPWCHRETQLSTQTLTWIDHICWSIHLLIDTRVASTSWLWWTVLLWTRVYKCLLETLLSILLGTYPEVELLDHTVILVLILEEISLFPRVALHFTFPSTGDKVPIFPHPPQCHYFGFFDSNHPDACEVLSHFSKDVVMLRIFSYARWLFV